MRLFGSDRIAGMMNRLGVQEGEVIAHSLVTKSIERAQKRVEGHNFDIRKQLLEYDDVMNQQREVVYGLRNSVLDGEDIRARIMEMLGGAIACAAATYLPEDRKGGRTGTCPDCRGRWRPFSFRPVSFAALGESSGRDEVCGAAAWPPRTRRTPTGRRSSGSRCARSSGAFCSR